ncbi:MAG: Zn-ribbon domain-containing OB-fold protein [Actinomycetota bacterium]
MQTVPAVEGWFTQDPPALIGSRCDSCGTYFFPKELFFCKNPACTSSELEEVSLSTHGKVWSYTINHYAPPEPSVTVAPYGVAAVQLEKEQMIVLGQVSGDLSKLKVGANAQLVIETLCTDDEGEHLVWRWSIR